MTTATTQQRLRARISAPLCLLGFLAVYLIAVRTPFGQRAENSLFGAGEVGAKPAWIYDWSGAAYGSSALPPLEHTAMPTLLVGMAAIAIVTLVRRCWWQGVAAIAVVVATMGGKEVARMILTRPDLVGARESLIESSFPSGHVAIPAALALGAVLVASPRVRPYVTVAGMLWIAVIAAAVLATYHHRSSDVLGSTLLACACYCLAVRLLPSAHAPAHAPGDATVDTPGDAPADTPADAPGVTRHSRTLPAVALAVSAVGALLAGARDDSLTQSLVFATAGFLCAALFWFTTTQRPARTGR
ncbi:phosphatase PAP2 family protein [Streptomyces sp. NPDC093109]|uniref:phosphatase PAP2 family protein n=1 Tax=Streptomyces sp. NPDC093109 TaxID=3154977 RepID=UPI00344DF498